MLLLPPPHTALPCHDSYYADVIISLRYAAIRHFVIMIPFSSLPSPPLRHIDFAAIISPLIDADADAAMRAAPV